MRSGEKHDGRASSHTENFTLATAQDSRSNWFTWKMALLFACVFLFYTLNHRAVLRCSHVGKYFPFVCG